MSELEAFLKIISTERGHNMLGLSASENPVNVHAMVGSKI
jgi:hypothetical protein